MDSGPHDHRKGGVGRKSDGEVWPCVEAEECENSVRNAKAGPLGFLWA
jgi:hypothetical protein